jgi:hypothetical protein
MRVEVFLVAVARSVVVAGLLVAVGGLVIVLNDGSLLYLVPAVAMIFCLNFIWAFFDNDGKRK